MADFNAGSIIGSMELDRDPYTAGLEEATRQAEEFENTRREATLDVDTEPADEAIDETKEKLSGIGDPVITPEVDPGPLDVEIEEIKAHFKALSTQTIHLKIQHNDIESLLADTGSLLDEVDQIAPAANDAFDSLGKAADGAAGSGGGGGSAAAGELPGGSGVLGIAAAVSGLSAALIPLGATAGLAFGGIAAGAVGAGTAIGSFALVAKADFGKMQADIKAVTAAQAEVASAKTTADKIAALKNLETAEKALHGPIGQAADAYHSLTSEMSKIESATAGPVFKTLTAFFDEGARILPAFEPLIVTTANAITSLVKSVGSKIDAGPLQEFLSVIKDGVGPAFKSLSGIGTNGIEAFFKLTEDFMPTALELLGWFDKVTADFNKNTGAGGDVGKFISYATKEVPVVLPLLKNLGMFIGDVVSMFAKGDGAGSSNGVIQSLTFMTAELPALLPLIKGLAIVFEGMVYGITGLEVALSGIEMLFHDTGVGIADAATYITKHWHSVPDFFENLWHDLSHYAQVYTNDIDRVAGVIGEVPHQIENDWRDVGHFFSGVGGDIKGAFAGAGSWLLHAGESLITGFWHGIEGGFNSLWGHIKVEELNIENTFSNADTLLFNVGEHLVDGLWGGFKAAFGGFVSKAHSLWNKLPGTRGSPSFEEMAPMLLIKTGQLAASGIAVGFQQGLQPAVSDMHNALYGASGALSLGGAVVGGSAGAQPSLQASIESLRNDIRALPQATGAAVGDTVADKFSQATIAGAKATVIAGRMG